jgi:ankyrin repeat protein
MVAAQLDPALDSSGHICPISKETGLPPRKSIDVHSQRDGGVDNNSKQHHSLAGQKHSETVSVWHPSTRWSSISADSACQASQGGLVVQAAPQQQQQLAAACRSRDVRHLQQLIARGNVDVSEAVDTSANAALHTVLLPYFGAGADATQAGSPVERPRGWLGGCFGGTAADVSRSGSVRALTPAAAAAAQQQQVALLLAAGADANARNGQGHTPLMLAVLQLLAACAGNSSSSLVTPALKVLELLCKHVLLDPNMKDAQGRTALAMLLHGQVEQQAQAPVSMAGKHSMSPSSSSIGGSNSSSGGVRSVQQQDARLPPLPPAAGSVAAHSTVYGAVQLKAVHMLLHRGADCNAADKTGMMPLMYAAAQPSVTKDLLQLLLERGANPRQLDNNRRSALTHALLAHGLKLVPAVAAGGSSEQQCAACAGIASTKPPAAAVACKDVHADARGSHPASNLIKAAADDDTAAAAAGGGSSSACSSRGGSSGKSGSCGGPDLHAQVHTCSTYSGVSSSNMPFGLPNPRHSMVVRALCSYGALDLHPASINTRFVGLNGFTQLHIAMRRGDVMAVQMLLAGGADVNATDSWGNSPLMYWPVAPSEPDELVEELVGKLLSHVSVLTQWLH